MSGDALRVHLEGSFKGRVRVEALSLDATGAFRCEVSAERPSFHTESKSHPLEVVGEWRGSRIEE